MIDVFLVEDLESIQSAMTQMLQGLGDFRVLATKSTEAEALAWLEAHRGEWSLAIIDLVLDQGSGMSVISRCRTTSATGKVVVFSNFVTPGIRAHCLKLGADAAFDKNSQLRDFADFCTDLAAGRAHPNP